VSDRITRGRNAIFGHVARLPDNIPAHQAMLRQVELSVGRPADRTRKRPPGRPRAKWTDQLRRDINNVPIATLWRQAAVTRERRCAVRADCALTTTTQFTLSANNSAFSSSQLLQGLSEANASPAYSAALPSLVFLDIKGGIRNVSQSRQNPRRVCVTRRRTACH